MDWDTKSMLNEKEFHQFLHDLSTPATIISLNLDLLAKKMKKHSDPEIIKYIERLQSGSQKLDTLIHSLRDQSKK